MSRLPVFPRPRPHVRYVDNSFDPYRLDEIMRVSHENNLLKQKIEEIHEHYSKTTGFPLEGYEVRQRCLKLEKALKNSQDVIKERDLQITEERNEMSDLFKQTEDLKLQLNISQSRMRLAEQELREFNTPAVENQMLVDEMVIKLRHYKDEIFSLQPAFKEFHQWKTLIETVNGRNEALTNGIGHLESKLNALLKNDDRQEEMIHLKTRIQELEKSEASLQKENSELKGKVSLCEKKLSSLSDDVEKQRQNELVQSLTEKISLKDSQTSELQFKLNKLNVALENKTEQLTNLSKDAWSFVESFSDQAGILLGKKEPAQLPAAFEKIRVYMKNSLEGQISRRNLHKNLTEKSAALKRAEQELVCKNNTIDELVLQLQDTKTKITEDLQQEMDEKDSTIQDCQQTLATNTLKLEEMKQKHDKELAQLELNSQKEKTKYTKEIDQLKEKLGILEYELKSLQNQDFEPDQELSIKVEELTQELLISQEKQQCLQKECEELRKQIQPLSAEKSASEDKLGRRNLDTKPTNVKKMEAPLKTTKKEEKVLSPGNKSPKTQVPNNKTSTGSCLGSDPKRDKSLGTKTSPKEDARVKTTNKRVVEEKKMEVSPKKTEKEKEFISPKDEAGEEESWDSMLKSLGLTQDDIIEDRCLSGSEEKAEKSFRTETSPKENKYMKTPNKRGAEETKMDTTLKKSEKVKELISPKDESGEDSFWNDRGLSEVMIEDRCLSGSEEKAEKSFRTKTSPKEDTAMKTPNKRVVEEKKMELSPKEIEQEKEFISPGKTSPGLGTGRLERRKTMAEADGSEDVVKKEPYLRPGLNPIPRTTGLRPIRGRTLEQGTVAKKALPPLTRTVAKKALPPLTRKPPL